MTDLRERLQTTLGTAYALELNSAAVACPGFGVRDKAISHYSRFVELWKNADAELQPLVRSAQERLASLQRVER